LLVAIGLGAALFAGYQFLPGLTGGSASAAKKDAPAAETAVAKALNAHPLAKYIEITGFAPWKMRANPRCGSWW